MSKGNSDAKAGVGSVCGPWMPFILLLAVTALHAAPPYRVEHIGGGAGLSQSHVYHILQDSRGLMWFATRDGLNLYDGYKFTVFRHIPFDSSSPANSGIRAIAETADGAIWIGVGSLGLNRLDRRSRRCTLYRFEQDDPRKLSGKQISCLRVDRAERLWVGTDNGLFSYHPRRERFSRVGLEGTSAPVSVADIFEDRKGTLWVSDHSHNLYRLQTATQTLELVQPETGGYQILGEDGSGALYLGSHNGTYDPGDPLLYSFDPRSGRCTPLLSEFAPLPDLLQQPCEIHTLGIDRRGALWLRILPAQLNLDRLQTGGIFRLTGRGEPAFGPIDEACQADGMDHSFFNSTDGIVWIGGSRGLVKLPPNYSRFTTHRHSADRGSLSHDVIRSVYVDSRGTLWVGTRLGLNRWSDSTRTWQRFTYSSETVSQREAAMVDHNTINVVHEDRDGSLLLGSNAGLKRLNRKDGVLSDAGYHGSDNEGYDYSRVFALHRDSTGLLWVGTLQRGIILYDWNKRRVGRIQADPSGDYSGGLVWCMQRDSFGQFWVGTSNGLNRLIPGTRSFVVYQPDSQRRDALSGENICALFEDRDRRLWAVAHGAGINRYERERDSFTPLTTRDGLPEDAVYGLLQDASGALWLSGNKGLSCYRPQEKIFRNYTDRDGLQSNEFTFNAHAAGPDGRLYFGGVKGLSDFHPQEIQDNPHVPPIIITAFNVFDSLWCSEIRDGDTLAIDYRQNFISFEFAALDYCDPGQNQYAYQLTGFNTTWVYSGARRRAEFTNLDPGTYTFRVKGSNNDGVWNNKGVALTLIIHPPFWLSLWFRVATIGGGILIIGLTILVRVRASLSRNLLRRRMLEYRLLSLRLRMNPHFIFNSLTSIEYLMMSGDVDRAGEYLNRFAQLVRSILDNANSSTLPIAEEINNLKLYLELEALRFQQAFHYDIRIDPRLDVHTDQIPSMLIQPYVENALRHGMIHTIEQGCVTISLRRFGTVLQCVIEDNGIGRARARARQRRVHPPLAMSLCGERLQLLNHTRRDQVSSTIRDLYKSDGSPCGTRVELRIPLEGRRSDNERRTS